MLKHTDPEKIYNDICENVKQTHGIQFNNEAPELQEVKQQIIDRENVNNSFRDLLNKINKNLANKKVEEVKSIEEAGALYSWACKNASEFIASKGIYTSDQIGWTTKHLYITSDLMISDNAGCFDNLEVEEFRNMLIKELTK